MKIDRPSVVPMPPALFADGLEVGHTYAMCHGSEGQYVLPHDQHIVTRMALPLSGEAVLVNLSNNIVTPIAEVSKKMRFRRVELLIQLKD